MIERKGTTGDVHKRPETVIKEAAEEKKENDKKFRLI